ncbi:MAG: carboxypeptidase regulatory-like domain-containing protein [Desulfobacteraceae bacterium]|nr:carboxypeptidase regulatory-like domain-containing protein [Desulfobacteraceae bacterium]
MIKRTHIMWKIFMLVLSLFLTVVAFGQEVRPLTCTVKVFDALARPVVGAEVEAYTYGSSGSSFGQIHMEILGRAKTNADGKVILNIKVVSHRDRYFLVARKAGLALGWARFKPKLTILLDKPFVLAGKVLDKMDQPIAGARLRVFPRYSWLTGLMNAVVGVPEEWFTTETDVNGKFSFNNIPGEVTSDLLIEAPGRASVYTSMAPDGILGWRFAAGRTDIRVVLPPEAKIQGRVVNTHGDGVAGVRLLTRPISPMGTWYCPESIFSEEEGYFCFKGLAADTYVLQVVAYSGESGEWVGKDVKVIAKAGQTTAGVTMEVAKGAILEIVVCESTTKRPIRDIWVSVSQESIFGRDFVLLGFKRRARTDTNGVVRLQVPLGQCRIAVGGRVEYSNSRESYIVEHEFSQLKILLDREPHITRMVYDQAGKPIGGAIVDVLPTSNGAVQTDSRGSFEVYWRGARGTSRMYVLAQHSERNLAVISEIKKQADSLKIQLEPALTLTGRVTDPKGTPIPATRVQLMAEVTNKITTVGAEVITDARGYYEIKAVPPEREDFYYYCIKFAASRYGPLKLSEILLPDTFQGWVELGTLVLPPANMSIAGVVVDAKDKPVPDISVFLGGLRGSSYGQPSQHILTNANGEFVFDRVCSGPLTLQVSDYKGNMGKLHAEGGDTQVKIIMGQERTHARYVSLRSKPFPNFKNIKPVFSPEQAKGKMILVCFFEYEQRPSRWCITQLTKQAKKLAEKGVTVIAVQASKVDESELDEWVKKNNVPFPVGMIEGDEKKTRFNWGVKSLPWLILTDRKHVVVGEGFALQELDDKLKTD